MVSQELFYEGFLLTEFVLQRIYLVQRVLNLLLDTVSLLLLVEEFAEVLAGWQHL